MRKIIYSILLCAALSTTSFADTFVEAGPTFLSGELSEGLSLVASQRFADNWDLHFGYVSPQVGDLSTGRSVVKQNMFVGAGGVMNGPDVYVLRHLFAGAGLSAWYKTSFVTSNAINYHVSLGTNLKFTNVPLFSSGNWALVGRYFFNAGSGGPVGGGENVGQGSLALQWKVR